MDVRSCVPLEHLERMTDSTRLIQHAIYSIPRRESGYSNRQPLWNPVFNMPTSSSSMLLFGLAGLVAIFVLLFFFE